MDEEQKTMLKRLAALIVALDLMKLMMDQMARTVQALTDKTFGQDVT